MTPSDWPWQYSFPPFFTLQPNLETRKRQLNAWSNLVLKYHRLNKQYLLDIKEGEVSPLFSNTSIDRNLSTEGVLLILNSLNKSGNAEPADSSRTRWFIYWHTLEEWANIIYSWAQENSQIGTVCTLYEIKSTENEEFSDMNEEVLVKILKVLEHKNKAELIMYDDNRGVKFF